MNVHWLCPLPTHYHAYLFRSVASGVGVPLTVHFLRRGRSSHPWQVTWSGGFSARTIDPGLGMDRILHRIIEQEPRSLFVVAGWHGTVAMSLLAHLMIRGRAFCIWTDTPKLSGRRASTKAVLRTIWLRAVFRSATAVLGTGRPAVAALRELGAAPERVYDFPFAVDLDAFHPEDRTVPPAAHRELVFLSVGRLVNRLKGLDLALRALADLRAKTSRPFKYRIAGGGPDRHALESLATELGIRDAVEFAGWVEARDLPAFYRSGDVLLHPARLDPFPNVVLEAMACGIPVVGSDAAGSVVDRVVDGVSGFVHRCGDEAHLAKILQQISAQPEMLTALGEHARARAAEWPVQRNLTILQHILELCPGSPNGHRRLPTVVRAETTLSRMTRPTPRRR
jgi:glycosyltransferase involved in cell wall biosynthesis